MSNSLFRVKPVEPAPHVDAGEPVEGSLQGEATLKRTLTARHLILLGIGWNFGFIGATAMLTRASRPEERSRIQGLNDLVVFGGVFVASLSSGGLMNCAGVTSAAAGWSAVNLAMVPFLVLAGGALIWLVLRPKEA